MKIDLTYALVLDGGGARGAYQMGALKALKDYDIKVEAVAGTSVGALNGAIYCQDDLELGYEIWEKLDYRSVFAFEDKMIESVSAIKKLDLKNVDFSALTNGVIKVIKDGGLDIGPMRHLIKSHIDETAIRDSGISFGLVTVNLTDKKPEELFLEDMPVGLLGDYILASSYVPMFKSEGFDGKSYLDGGFYDNSPINMILNRGYKNVVVIKLGGKLGIQRSYDGSERNIYVIEPREDLGDLLEFDLKRIKYNLHLGYYDAKKVILNLSGDKYYFQSMATSEDIVKAFASIKKEEVLVLRSIWPSNQEDPLRYIFEEVLGQVRATLNMTKDWTYESLLIGLIEYFMTKLKKNRFNVYDWQSYKMTLLEQIKGYKKEQPDEIALDVILKLLIKNTLDK